MCRPHPHPSNFHTVPKSNNILERVESENDKFPSLGVRTTANASSSETLLQMITLIILIIALGIQIILDLLNTHKDRHWWMLRNTKSDSALKTGVYRVQHSAEIEALSILTQSVDAHFSSALPLGAPIHGTSWSHLSNQLAPSTLLTLPELHLKSVSHLDLEEHN